MCWIMLDLCMNFGGTYRNVFDQRVMWVVWDQPWHQAEFLYHAHPCSNYTGLGRLGVCFLNRNFTHVPSIQEFGSLMSDCIEPIPRDSSREWCSVELIIPLTGVPGNSANWSSRRRWLSPSRLIDAGCVRLPEGLEKHQTPSPTDMGTVWIVIEDLEGHRVVVPSY